MPANSYTPVLPDTASFTREESAARSRETVAAASGLAWASLTSPVILVPDCARAAEAVRKEAAISVKIFLILIGLGLFKTCTKIPAFFHPFNRIMIKRILSLLKGSIYLWIHQRQ